MKHNNDTIKKERNFTNKLTITDNKFNNDSELLSYLKLQNIDKIYIFNKTFLQNYSLIIKECLPEISLDYFTYEQNKDIVPFLTYLDHLYVRDYDTCKFYNMKNRTRKKKPILKIITVITFGTFDLFHYGHNNILQRCQNYGDNIIVGVSSDDLNIRKKNMKPFESLDERMNNIINSGYVTDVFIEEFLELKNNYIKQHDSNILIMGDDWKDKFNWVDCAAIYLPRTPIISSTLLRKYLTFINKPNKNIKHAGGSISTYLYTNSYEAVMNSIKEKYEFIELDVIKIKDGYIFAHNGMEKELYNLDKNFNEITQNEYNELKIYNKFTPLSFESLNNIMDEYKNIKFIWDIKFISSDILHDFVQYLINNNVIKYLDRIYFQISDDNELDIILANNIKNIIIGTWKYYINNPYSEDIKSMVNKAKINKLNLLGMSMCFSNEKLYEMNKGFLKEEQINIFYHGYKKELSVDELEKYNSDNIYFFVDYMFEENLSNK